MTTPLAMDVQTARGFANNTPNVRPTADMSRARMAEVAQDFEAFYLGQMLQPMFANIEAASPFGGGPGEDVWKTMLVDEYGRQVARQGGVGIADMVMRQMIEMQEALGS